MNPTDELLARAAEERTKGDGLRANAAKPLGTDPVLFGMAQAHYHRADAFTEAAEMIGVSA